ncbi:4-hydroxyphenylpyruvate dioxygenase [Actinoplanes oblitus]|uniref:4-hydroxyphenylpyruvate dioxygenase n=1 Tax=Actinoplanes oblitus TaxID=3040509 RepID=A0ABY8W997_9ACTN|nr:4-hydroxyphenylpyruvate dioxygenase [Actinoplanes oblitus]WIM94436.1 4-hydroxyphenylpyruvate dioxygenase [Actinoplanes oblitus]
MDIRTIDHLEIFTENAEETAATLCTGFGFTVQGRSGPETGRTDCLSLLLRQHDITLLVTTPLAAGHRAHEYLARHGEGIAVVGFAVDDAAAAFTEAVERGALPLEPPNTNGGEADAVTFASVDGFGDVEHRFTSRRQPSGLFAPGLFAERPQPATGLLRDVDHLAVCLPAGQLDGAIRRYRDVFDLEQTFEEQIIVGSQAMRSKVVQSASRGVTFTIIEPDLTRDPGQIDAFIEAHDGAGVQHVAFRTEDIVAGVRACGAGGVPFLSTPGEYYQALPGRLGSVGVPVEQLREFSILADRDYAGVMLQIFTASVHPRRTLFYELIERRGARTFGSNNIKALYEAVEREQAAAQS